MEIIGSPPVVYGRIAGPSIIWYNAGHLIELIARLLLTGRSQLKQYGGYIQDFRTPPVIIETMATGIHNELHVPGPYTTVQSNLIL